MNEVIRERIEELNPEALFINFNKKTSALVVEDELFLSERSEDILLFLQNN